MDSIKPSGYLQLIRKRNNKEELLYSGTNAISSVYFSSILWGMIERVWDSPSTDDNRSKNYPYIDGIGLGSAALTEGYFGTNIWATYAGTFWFGTNANFQCISWTSDDTTPRATFAGTFNFTGAATVNFIQLGFGTHVMHWGSTQDASFASVSQSAYKSILAYKVYQDGAQLTFGTNDILRINWYITF